MSRLKYMYVYVLVFDETIKNDTSYYRVETGRVDQRNENHPAVTRSLHAETSRPDSARDSSTATSLATTKRLMKCLKR